MTPEIGMPPPSDVTFTEFTADGRPKIEVPDYSTSVRCRNGHPYDGRALEFELRRLLRAGFGLFGLRQILDRDDALSIDRMSSAYFERYRAERSRAEGLRCDQFDCDAGVVVEGGRYEDDEEEDEEDDGGWPIDE